MTLPVDAPTASPAVRNAASVPAVMPSEMSGVSAAPAVTATMQPTMTAGLFGESPASVPPATAITVSDATVRRYLRRAHIQTTHAAADIASATAIARPRAPGPPGCGLARVTVTSTTAMPRARITSTARDTSIARAVITGSA